MLATISDRKFGVSSGGSSLIDYYEPDIVTAQDYYPFGMLSREALPNSGVPYKFGFNGKMNDNEVKGLGLQQDYGMRIYDNRVGRFLSVDPLTKNYPWYTPYQFAGNNPVKFIDLDGGEPLDPNKYVNSDAPSVDPKYKNVNLHQPQPKLEGAASLGAKILWNGYLALCGVLEGPAASEYGDRVKDKAKAFPITHGSAKGMLVAPAAIVMELKKDPTNEDAWAQAALFAFPLAKGIGRYAKVGELDPVIAKMSTPLTDALPSLSKSTMLTVDEAIAGKVTAKITTAQPNGRNFAFTIEDKAIKFVDKGNKASWYDFVIMENGELRLGRGHWYLSNGAKKITGAGEVYIDEAGKIASVTNNTGHYKTSQGEAVNSARTFKRNGVATEDIHVIDVTK